MGQDAGQKRAWDKESERERKRLYRERKRAQLESPDLPARDIDEEPDRPVVSDAPAILGITLKEYVERAGGEAEAYANSISETDAPYRLSAEQTIVGRRSDRVARAKAYARWRYEGVASGEVARL